MTKNFLAFHFLFAYTFKQKYLTEIISDITLSPEIRKKSEICLYYSIFSITKSDIQISVYRFIRNNKLNLTFMFYCTTLTSSSIFIEESVINLKLLFHFFFSIVANINATQLDNRRLHTFIKPMKNYT